MAVVPFWTLALLNRPKSGTRPIAEAVFACLFGAAALYATFNEGSRNWQASWTAGAYFLLGITLWRARSVAVARTPSTVPADVSDVDFLGKAGGIQSDRHRLRPEPASQA
ncbi:MAG: hypothetical protein WCC91_00640 [Bradyrhizobium sp.]